MTSHSQIECPRPVDSSSVPPPCGFQLSAPALWFSHHQICEWEAPLLGAPALKCAKHQVNSSSVPPPRGFQLSAPAP